MPSTPAWSGGRNEKRPADLERALYESDDPGEISPDVRRRAEAHLSQLKRRLLHLVCSWPWFEACWTSGTAYPPPADTTPMVPCRCARCRRCGRLWPAGYAAPGVPEGAGVDDVDAAAPAPPGAILSYECYLESLTDREAANLPSSPSGIALRAIREGRLRVRFRRGKKRRA